MNIYSTLLDGCKATKEVGSRLGKALSRGRGLGRFGALLLPTLALMVSVTPQVNAAQPLSCSVALSNGTDTIAAGDTITATGTTQGGQGRKSYAWNTGGVPLDPTSSTVDVTYAAPGSFTVGLTVTDNKGSSAICAAALTVAPASGANPPTASANGPYAATTETAVSFSSAGTTGAVSYSWEFGDGGTSTAADPTHTYTVAGTYAVTLTVTDSSDQSDSDTTTAVISQIPKVSINSTSQNATPDVVAPSEQDLVNQSAYRVFAINDLGMHCGDLDTRVSSILPPFNVLHATVIQRGGEPSVLTPADGVSVVYSAASNQSDPILTGINSAGSGPVASSLLPDGSVYKTNFWDAVADGAYDPFYPANNPFDGGALTPLAAAPFSVVADVGLPMPDVELLYLHDPAGLEASQQKMPGISGPFLANVPQEFNQFVTDQPFFINPAFKFGYVKEGVDWFEAAGLPLTAYDDYGRENPWPLYRVQAIRSGSILASVDTVVPISGEANCGACHNAIADGGNGSATQALDDAGVEIATAEQDSGNVPMDVSLEWAADTNILRLHDLRHGSGSADPKYTPDLVEQTPVVCQTCHYTPALDLAQLGPLGPENDPDNTLRNGRDQIKHKSMSNVMHSHHGSVTDADGDKLFPDMPPAQKDDNGVVTNAAERRLALEATCYQCHPGRRTDCLRGAMANGGMLCQDCHGNMQQVGDDFTRSVAVDSPGTFELGGDFYTNPQQPRVPWANEPGCGSCHTGDAIDNLAGTDGTVVNNVDTNMNDDGIRLFQAFRSGDTKATPIVPANKRFAENVIEANNPAVSADDPRIGNPMLYRVSTGHGGVFCEACHGATHGIWPNKNPNANDNVTAMQLQGHTGSITECDTCHTGSFNIDDFKSSVAQTGEMAGPHGMHPVNNSMWNEKHKEVFERNKNSCRACHGTDGKGTVLSATATIRTFECKNEHGNFPGCASGSKYVTVEADTIVGCDNCHSMEN